MAAASARDPHQKPASVVARIQLLWDIGLGTAVAIVWLAGIAFWRERGWLPPDPEAWTVAGIALGVALALRRSASPALLCACALLYPFIYLRPLVSELHLVPVIVAGYAAAQRSAHPLRVAACCAGAILLLFSPLMRAASLLPMDLWYAIETARFEPALSGTRVQVLGEWPLDWSELTVALVATVGTVLLGATLAAQRATAQALGERNAELERLRVVEAEQAVGDERMRIAREFHDVAAHHLTAIVMRAQAAAHVAERRPDEAVSAVEWIAEEGREALSATRNAVGSLRRRSPAATGASFGAEIRRIVDRMETAGLPVRLHYDCPEQPPLAAAAALAARRCAEEGLTNVARHGGAGADLSVRSEAGGIALSVRDPGRPDRQPGGARTPGSGLLGLRERLSACGGRFDAGPLPEGGWLLSAWVPCDDTEEGP